MQTSPWQPQLPFYTQWLTLQRQQQLPWYIDLGLSTQNELVELSWQCIDFCMAPSLQYALRKEGIGHATQIRRSMQRKRF